MILLFGEYLECDRIRNRQNLGIFGIKDVGALDSQNETVQVVCSERDHEARQVSFFARNKAECGKRKGEALGHFHEELFLEDLDGLLQICQHSVFGLEVLGGRPGLFSSFWIYLWKTKNL